MRKVVSAVLLIAVIALLLYYHFQSEPPITIEFDGVTWTQVSHWDFRDAFYLFLSVGSFLSLQVRNYCSWNTSGDRSNKESGEAQAAGEMRTILQVGFPGHVSMASYIG